MSDDNMPQTPPQPNENGSAGNGQVNQAFEDTENKPNGDTHQMNGNKSPPPINGSSPHPKSPDNKMNGVDGKTQEENGDVKTSVEAVNLELVNMQPYSNSIPVKKESTELDMGDPYDEYFVPVNQHKKYIRGEKLYVTQDKRRNMNDGKKKFCWGAVIVIALGVVIAVLLAILLSQDADSPVESRTFNKAHANVGGPGGTVVSTPPPVSAPPSPRPTTDMSQMYMPQLLQGELTIDNMEFTPGLASHNTSEFNMLATSLEDELKNALFDQHTLLYGASDISVKVIEFRPGSVVVVYRVGWSFKTGIHKPQDPINVDKLKARLQSHLREKDGFLYNYRLPIHSLKAERVIDSCILDNGGCSHICGFNMTTLQFYCSCTSEMVLSSDMHTCEEPKATSTEDSGEDLWPTFPDASPALEPNVNPHEPEPAPIEPHHHHHHEEDHHAHHDHTVPVPTSSTTEAPMPSSSSDKPVFETPTHDYEGYAVVEHSSDEHESHEHSSEAPEPSSSTTETQHSIHLIHEHEGGVDTPTTTSETPESSSKTTVPEDAEQDKDHMMVHPEMSSSSEMTPEEPIHSMHDMSSQSMEETEEPSTAAPVLNVSEGSSTESSIPSLDIMEHSQETHDETMEKNTQQPETTEKMSEVSMEEGHNFADTVSKRVTNADYTSPVTESSVSPSEPTHIESSSSTPEDKEPVMSSETAIVEPSSTSSAPMLSSSPSSEKPNTESHMAEGLPMHSFPTEIPDLAGPFTVDTIIQHEPEEEFETDHKNTSLFEVSTSEPKPNKTDEERLSGIIYESNNTLNSLDYDYQESKYTKLHKGNKHVKSFNVKEINVPSFDATKAPPVTKSTTTEPAHHEPTTALPTKSSQVNVLLSEGPFVTVNPVFETYQPEKAPESTSEQPSKVSDFFTNDAEATDSPLFSDLDHSSTKTQSVVTTPVPERKEETITTTSPPMPSSSSSHMFTEEAFSTNSPLFEPKSEQPSSTTTTESSAERDFALLDEAEATMTPLFGVEATTTKSDMTETTDTMTTVKRSVSVDEAGGMAEERKDIESTTPMPASAESTLTPTTTPKLAEKKPEKISDFKGLINDFNEPETTPSTELVDSTEDSAEMPETSTDAVTITDPVVGMILNASSKHPKCSAGQMSCKSGAGCILPSQRCDSIPDCEDGSDELGCAENKCFDNFQCSDKSCIKRQNVCDKVPQCSDGSDENDCESRKCEEDEFGCGNGQCIPSIFRCNGKSECHNGADEQDC